MRSPVFAIIVGTIMWVVAFVIAIASNATTNTIWICVSGAALGLVGLRYTIRRGRRGQL
ncbi:MAG: DUF2530 domain-containing protein [Actinomycetes bacterium]